MNVSRMYKNIDILIKQGIIKSNKIIKKIPKNLKEYNRDLFIEDTSNYVCGICLGVIFDATKCIPESKNSNVCGHIFCKKCLENWKQISNNNKCPTCKTSISKTLKAPEINKQIMNMKIKCEFCDWNGIMGMNGEVYCKHIKKCKYKNIKCRACDTTMVAKNMKNHNCKINICPYNILGCESKEKALSSHIFKNHNHHINLILDKLYNYIKNVKEYIPFIKIDVIIITKELIELKQVIGECLYKEMGCLKNDMYEDLDFHNNCNISYHEAIVIDYTINERKKIENMCITYLIGKKIKAHWNSLESRLYNGKIIDIRIKHCVLFDIHFDDGDKSNEVPIEYIGEFDGLPHKYFADMIRVFFSRQLCNKSNSKNITHNTENIYYVYPKN